jgi:protein involved in ribonucleotide reduction
MRVIVQSALALALLSGCGGKMTERDVREFVDSADHAFSAGRVSDICKMRSDDFQLTSTTFKLAQGHIVSGLAEAEAIEDERHESGERLKSETASMNAKEYCRMALMEHRFYKRTTLERTELKIQLDPGGKRAVVNAHYIVKQPVYDYDGSPLSNSDRVERQVATLQTESDEESVVTTDTHGDLVFSATKAVSKSFQVPQLRDSSL